ncbi:transposase [Thalassospira marina]|uniref:transposase n=1 Tax=Thalassospira marina TaxID=2048283 RepID=UPI003CCC4646
MPRNRHHDRQTDRIPCRPCPVTRQSGQWRGKAFIQGGRKFLRDALYMPALVCALYNPDFRQKYQAMTEAQ